MSRQPNQPVFTSLGALCDITQGTAPSPRRVTPPTEFTPPLPPPFFSTSLSLPQSNNQTLLGWSARGKRRSGGGRPVGGGWAAGGRDLYGYLSTNTCLHSRAFGQHPTRRTGEICSSQPLNVGGGGVWREGLCGHSLRRWGEEGEEGGRGPSGRVISGPCSRGGHRCR